ncbi:unnamed protein product [Amoebophrya sp. A25]|nr:unnamed protein product [Amoebophrya sp. A25]|eukprot:GSA25T00014327001.1
MSGVSPSDGAMPFEIGQRVSVSRRLGSVRYVGKPPFAPGIWVGIELDDAVGKNDGSVQGQYYFQCKPKHGVFVKAEQVQVAQAPGAPVGERTTSGEPKASTSARTAVGSQQGAQPASARGGTQQPQLERTGSRQPEVPLTGSQSVAKQTRSAEGNDEQKGEYISSSDEVAALRKKYDDLKRVAQQYKAQNEELKKSLRAQKAAAAATASSTTGGAPLEDSTLSTAASQLADAEISVVRLDLELANARIEELELQLSLAGTASSDTADESQGQAPEEKDSPEELKLKSALQSAWQTLQARLEKQKADLAQRDKKLQALSVELEEQRELSNLQAEADQKQAEIDAMHAEIVRELQAQIADKEDIIRGIEEAVNEMRSDLETAYAANAAFQERTMAMEAKLRMHALHDDQPGSATTSDDHTRSKNDASRDKRGKAGDPEKQKANASTARLSTELLATMVVSNRQQLQTFGESLPSTTIQGFALQPLAASVYGSISRAAGLIADHLRSLPQKKMSALTCRIEASLRRVQHALTLVFFSAASASSASSASPPSDDTGDGQPPSQTRRTRVMDLDTQSATFDLQTVSDFAVSLINALDNPEQAVLPKTLAVSAKALAAKSVALARKALGEGGGEDPTQLRDANAETNALLTHLLLLEAHAICRGGAILVPDVASFASGQAVLEKQLLSQENASFSSAGFTGGTPEQQTRLKKSLATAGMWLEREETPSREKLEPAAVAVVVTVQEILPAIGKSGQVDAAEGAAGAQRVGAPIMADDVARTMIAQLATQWVQKSSEDLAETMKRFAQVSDASTRQSLAIVGDAEKTAVALKESEQAVSQWRMRAETAERKAADFEYQVSTAQALVQDSAHLRKQIAVAEERAAAVAERSEIVQEKLNEAEAGKTKYQRRYVELHTVVNKLRQEQKTSGVREVSSLRQLCTRYRKELYESQLRASSSAWGSVENSSYAGPGGKQTTNILDMLYGRSTIGSSSSSYSNKSNSSSSSATGAGERDPTTSSNSTSVMNRLMRLAQTQLVDLDNRGDWLAPDGTLIMDELPVALEVNNPNGGALPLGAIGNARGGKSSNARADVPASRSREPVAIIRLGQKNVADTWDASKAKQLPSQTIEEEVLASRDDVLRIRNMLLE